MPDASPLPYADFPPTYRSEIVEPILRAVSAGECAQVVGLSGSGKSNLLGFLAHRPEVVAAHTNRPLRLALVDCNRLSDRTPDGFFRLALRALQPDADSVRPLDSLDTIISSLPPPVSLLLDRFDDLARTVDRSLFNNLRALRDAHKFRLTFVAATRHSLATLRSPDDIGEFAELFTAHTLTLGAYSEADAIWNVERFAARHGVEISTEEASALTALTGGYPTLLRGALEAWDGGESSAEKLSKHPALEPRLQELMEDLSPAQLLALANLAKGRGVGPQGGVAELRALGLIGPDGGPIPLVAEHLARAGDSVPLGLTFDTSTDLITRDGERLEVGLTPKERGLLIYFVQRRGEVCEKDDLIRAVWAEDAIFERGVRDDSLAQIVRRLREKVERDPSRPAFLLTVPGRGYRLL